jgi:hypothetical protein
VSAVEIAALALCYGLCVALLAAGSTLAAGLMAGSALIVLGVVIGRC